MPPVMSSSRDPTARLRAGLNPLLTASLGGYHGHNANATPLSAMSVGSHGVLSSGQTPVSAIQPYNPQEWIASPIVGPGPERMHQLQSSLPAQQFQEPQGALFTCMNTFMTGSDAGKANMFPKHRRHPHRPTPHLAADGR